MLSVAELESETDGLRATQRAFIDALTESGSITRAAKAIGISRYSPYDWLAAEKARGIDVDAENPEAGTFAHALQRAKRIAAEELLGRSYQAASEGTGMPATIERIFHIKRWFPEYRDQLNVKHSGAVLQARVDLNQLDHTERAELLRLTQRRLLLLQENVAPGDGDPVDGGD